MRALNGGAASDPVPRARPGQGALCRSEITPGRQITQGAKARSPQSSRAPSCPRHSRTRRQNSSVNSSIPPSRALGIAGGSRRASAPSRRGRWRASFPRARSEGPRLGVACGTRADRGSSAMLDRNLAPVGQIMSQLAQKADDAPPEGVWRGLLRVDALAALTPHRPPARAPNAPASPPAHPAGFARRPLAHA